MLELIYIFKVDWKIHPDMSENNIVIDKNDYKLTNFRALCRRASIWIGQTCNIRCKFCYYVDIIKDKNNPHHDFLPLEKLKKLCKTLVDKYGNNAVDIEGGEPTIYRDIFNFIEYCNEIGLKPSLITNGVALSQKYYCKKFKDAGVYDFLVSVHALGDLYDEIVQLKGASKRQLQALDNMKELGIPFRFNTVLTKEVLPQLMDVARLAVDKGARAVNFIAYNPFNDQSSEGKRCEDNIPRYNEVKEKLTPVIDYLEENLIEVNLRYLPFCIYEDRHKKNIQDFQQRIWDLHEWEPAGEAWTRRAEQRSADGDLSEPLNFYEMVIKSRDIFRLEGEENKYNYLIDKLKEKAQKPITVAIYGNTDLACDVASTIKNNEFLNDKIEIKSIISTKRYVTAQKAGEYPWNGEDWLIKNDVDVIIISSISAIEQIYNTLKDMNLADKAVFMFDYAAVIDSNEIKYSPEFYREELGIVEGFSDLEYAYKEFCVQSASGGYLKGEKCIKCSISPICDGFHKDYAKIFGFEEAKSIILDAKIYDPRYYLNSQLKVVEKEEYDWALP